MNFFFDSLEWRVFVLEYRKTHVPGLYYLKKKKLKNCPFLNQNQGLTPLEKCQFFDFLIFWFLEARKAFFRSRIWSKTFSWPILSKKKKLDKWSFLDENHGLTPLEKWQFFDFLNLFFYSLERRFFVLEYRKQRPFLGLYCLKKRSWKNGHFCTKTMG